MIIGYMSWTTRLTASDVVGYRPEISTDICARDILATSSRYRGDILLASDVAHDQISIEAVCSPANVLRTSSFSLIFPRTHHSHYIIFSFALFVVFQCILIQTLHWKRSFRRSPSLETMCSTSAIHGQQMGFAGSRRAVAYTQVLLPFVVPSGVQFR